MPASPAGKIEVKVLMNGDVVGTDWIDAGGLTKREHFAGLAMQGLMCGIEYDTEWSPKDYSKTSLAMADELLKELDK